MKVLLCLVPFFALAACTTGDSNQYDWAKDPRCLKGGAAEGCVEYFISMIDLIANAPKYVGKTVQVKGFVNLEFEGDAIYVSEVEYNNHVTKSAVWLEMQSAVPQSRTFTHLQGATCL